MPIAVSLVPRTPGRGEVAVIHLAPGVEELARLPAPAAMADEPHDLLVLVDAIEASAELRDSEAIARAVLQAIRPALRFEWGVVLKLFRQDHLDTPPAAEVVATYPTGLAGVDAGAAWAPLDPAERAVLEAGEPSLEGRLARSGEEQSPLRPPHRVRDALAPVRAIVRPGGFRRQRRRRPVQHPTGRVQPGRRLAPRTVRAPSRGHRRRRGRADCPRSSRHRRPRGVAGCVRARRAAELDAGAATDRGSRSAGRLRSGRGARAEQPARGRPRLRAVATATL